MNYMKQVANMLGVELNEEFNINLHGSRKYRFTEHGMEDFHEPIGQWMTCDYLFSILNGTIEIVKIPKPILDEKEKEYLGNIIKPFRERVSHIAKYEHTNIDDKTFHYIKINLISCDGTRVIDIDLPYFEKNTMYKGMEKGKKYSLEELGL